MTKRELTLLSVLTGFAVVYAYGRLHNHDKKIDQAITSTTLPAQDAARINFDPQTHVLTVITSGRDGNSGNHAGPERAVPASIRKTYIGTHPVRIDIDKAGAVSITTRKFGTETGPYCGLALGTDLRPRAALGLNLLYAGRWDVGGGILLSSDIHDTRVFTGVNYAAYSNIQVGLAIDNRKTAHLVASLRF